MNWQLQYQEVHAARKVPDVMGALTGALWPNPEVQGGLLESVEYRQARKDKGRGGASQALGKREQPLERAESSFG